MNQIRELQRLLGKKTMENEILKEAVSYGRSKMDSTCALIAWGMATDRSESSLGVSRA